MNKQDKLFMEEYAEQVEKEKTDVTNRREQFIKKVVGRYVPSREGGGPVQDKPKACIVAAQAASELDEVLTVLVHLSEYVEDSGLFDTAVIGNVILSLVKESVRYKEFLKDIGKTD